MVKGGREMKDWVKLSSCFLVCGLLSLEQVEANQIRRPHRRTPPQSVLQVMREHPESLKKWVESKIYLREDALYWASDDEAWLTCHFDRRPVVLADLGQDNEGWYILCKDYDPPSGPNKEAK